MDTDRRGVWAVVGCSAAVFWSGAFIFGFPGVMAPYWQQTLNVGRGAIGNILFFMLAAVGIFMFFVGHWQERVGIRWMITIGTVVMGANFFFAFYASSLFLLYLWAFIMGAASCFVYVPALTTVQRWFPMRRGLVSGIVNLTFGGAAAVMAPVFSYLLECIGYFAMMGSISVAAVVLGAVAAQFTEPPATDSIQSQAPSANSSTLGPSLTVSQSLRTRSFWCLWLTWALQGAAGIAMVTLSTAFGVSKGHGLDSAVFILTAFNLTNGLGRFMGGFLSDIIGRNLTMSAAFMMSGLAYFGLPHTNWLFFSVMLAAVIGLAFGTLFGVSAPLATDCFGIRNFGAIFGLVFTAYGFLSGAIGPSLSGYLLDITQGNYVIVFGYLGVFCIISSLTVLFVRPPRSVH
ncbi:MAG: MFS transporter [Desulfomonile tiedjei]|uniref:MFS transporter n=1 Tax=Desulfomonile tiedjei TaxID=2358 RepID=A0A9D6UYL6_9BACT|nr:MFS transporter [Desulfomonile tiedjei]